MQLNASLPEFLRHARRNENWLGRSYECWVIDLSGNRFVSAIRTSRPFPHSRLYTPTLSELLEFVPNIASLYEGRASPAARRYRSDQSRRAGDFLSIENAQPILVPNRVSGEKPPNLGGVICSGLPCEVT